MGDVILPDYDLMEVPGKINTKLINTMILKFLEEIVRYADSASIIQQHTYY